MHFLNGELDEESERLKFTCRVCHNDFEWKPTQDLVKSGKNFMKFFQQFRKFKKNKEKPDKQLACEALKIWEAVPIFDKIDYSVATEQNKFLCRLQNRRTDRLIQIICNVYENGEIDHGILDEAVREMKAWKALHRNI